MLKSVFSGFSFAVLVTAGISYLLGSVSFSIIFTKIFCNKMDIRSQGSGNAGLTNVIRSAGWKAGACTLIFDFSKGALAVLIGRFLFGLLCLKTGLPPYFEQYGAYIAGLACALGHIFPLFFEFRGGKGILTSSAVLAFTDWRVFIVAILVFCIVFIGTRIVSISSITGSIAFPVAYFIFTYFVDYAGGHSKYGHIPVSYVWVTMIFAVIIAFLLVFMHRENIRRLKNHTEKKFSVKHC